MRYVNFSGLMPKVKPQAIGASYAQVAENLDIGAETLRGFRAPGHAEVLRTPSGALFDGQPGSIYKAGDVWVAWSEHTWVVHDTQGAPGHESFLFVQDQALHWQSAQRVTMGLAPIKVGVCAPNTAPSAVSLPGLGCVESAPDLACVADPLAPGGACLPETPVLRAYLATYTKEYPGCDGRMEESAPSAPVAIECLDGDAISLTLPAPLPAGVTGVRWYRSVAGTDGRIVWLLCGESTGATYVDFACVHALGEPLRTERHYPPPGCVDGVANVGDALTVLWHGRRMWVSQPFLPHAYDVDRDEFAVLYDIVAVRGLPESFEGATTYEAHVLTTGKPYRLHGAQPDKLDVREIQQHHPCVSRASVCEHRGMTGYASPYGFVLFSGEQIEVLTDTWMTEAEWRSESPLTMHAAVWAGRIWIGHPDRNGLVLSLGGDGAARPRALVTHTVRVPCWYTRADLDLHVGALGAVLRWGTGRPLRWRWVGDRSVQAGMWRPGAFKVVSGDSWRWHDEDEAYAALLSWRQSHTEHDLDQFLAARPQWLHLREQMLDRCGHRVTVFCDGKEFYERRVAHTRPVRLPRRRRGLEWTISVSGYDEVREVHMQTSITDLEQGGGHA